MTKKLLFYCRRSWLEALRTKVDQMYKAVFSLEVVDFCSSERGMGFCGVYAQASTEFTTYVLLEDCGVYADPTTRKVVADNSYLRIAEISERLVALGLLRLQGVLDLKGV